VVSKVSIRKVTLEICCPALTVCLSHNPPQTARASFLPLPDVLWARICCQDGAGLGIHALGAKTAYIEPGSP
jgi:hypothetical protein